MSALNLTSANLGSKFDVERGTIAGVEKAERFLSDMRGYFVDDEAYSRALAAADLPLYSVASLAPDDGDGALHYGIGRIEAGRIGAEYFMTKGHFHAWRPAAETYIGLRGSGVMLLEDEAGGQATMVPLTPDSAVYVPGHTAHRTINTGDVPLVYLGIYPARAGHDYGAIATRNFRHVVIERNGAPRMVARKLYLQELGK